MTASTVTVRPVSGGPELDAFIQLPWAIYAGDPLWVPPLIADIRAALDPKHPFHQHAETALFLAWRDGRTVGRIAAIVNRAHNDYYQDRLGFFGLFECIDDQVVADALFQQAEAWLREHGRDSMQGPVNLSTNEEIASPGVLVDGFEYPPSVMMAHTPRYYVQLFERGGYAKAKDLVCYWADGEAAPERLMRGLDRVKRTEGITVRSLDMKKFASEVDTVQAIYNTAWERNWGFIPMTPEEIGFMAKHLKPVVSPTLCALAYAGDEPVAFALALPDYNQALKHLNGRLLPFGVFKLLWYRRRINALRVITLGVNPQHRQKGIDMMLIAHIFRESKKLNMPRGECSWILEDNWAMRRGIERIGGHVYKTYRVFQKDLNA